MEEACPRAFTTALSWINLIAVALGFSRRRHSGGPCRVQQTDAARDDDEHLFALEPGQRPAHGFDRQPQIVRDILPAHRQRDGLPLIADMSQTFSPADEEGRDLLLRSTP